MAPQSLRVHKLKFPLEFEHVLILLSEFIASFQWPFLLNSKHMQALILLSDFIASF